MKQLSRESGTYAIENMLVIIMFLAAIGLQIMRRKKGESQGPILLKLIESLTQAMVF